MPNELQHFGVKGMKWGVRKQQPSSVRSSILAGVYAATGNKRVARALDKSNDKDSEKWETAKKNQKIKELKKADKAWADDVTKNAMGYGDKVLASKAGSAALSKSYNSLIKAGLSGSALNNGLQQSIAGIIDRAWSADKTMYNPSGTRRLSMLEYRLPDGNSYLFPTVVDVDTVKHAAEMDEDEDEDEGEPEEETVLRFDLDSQSLVVVDITSEETGELIRHSYDVEAVLAHYGVLGMKWGTRRTSGPDGAVSSRPKAPRTPSNRKIKSARRKDVRNRRKMSDKDLMEKIGRLEKEKKLRELTDADIRPGKKAMGDILKTAGAKTLTTVAAGATLYGVKYILTGKVDPSDLAGYVAPKPGKK